MSANTSEEVVDCKVDIHKDRVRLVLGRISTVMPSDQAYRVGMWVLSCAQELAIKQSGNGVK